MIYNFVRRAITRSLITPLHRSYGELVYTQHLTVQSEFAKVPTYRAIDLDGHLLDKKVKYDLKYLNRILKTMIFVDEMDIILLKVKGQGTYSTTQERYLSICHHLVSMRASLDQLLGWSPKI
jgi:hypothetical protein